MYRKVIVSFVFVLAVNRLWSQSCSTVSETLPSTCLEIESLLVDACTNTEGLDEMARIRIGPNPIPLNSLTHVVWTSSNPFQGWAAFNAANLAKINTINAQIAAAGNCGHVIKVDPGETLPAYAKVLLITSTVYNVNAQNFSGLTDTLYVILHNNTTVTQGHFNNYGTSASRTFELGTSTCYDVVTYDRSFLRKQDGTVGAQDGGSVYFSYSGTPTYGNSGCTIPMTLLTVDAGTTDPAYCVSDLVLLNGSASGQKCIRWQLSNKLCGNLSDTNSITTVFVANPGYTGPVKVYLYAYGNCGKYSKDSVEFLITQPTDTLGISTRFTKALCNKGSLSLQAAGSSSLGAVVWSTSGGGTFSSNGSWNTVYTPAASDSGIIWIRVNQTLKCVRLADSVSVFLTPQPKANLQVLKTAICLNQPTLNLNPSDKGGSYNSPYVINHVFNNPGVPGTYPVKYVIERNGCSDSTSITIEVKETANAAFGLSDTLVCLGDPPVLITTTQSGGVFSGANVVSNQIATLQPGFYIIQYLINNGACEDSVTHTLTIENRGNPDFTIPDTLFCEGDAPVTMQALNNGGIYSGPFVSGSVFIPEKAGYYTIQHIFGTGKCADTSYHHVMVLPKPAASFNYTPRSFKVFDTVQFVYTGSTVTDYLWDFGDGSQSVLRNPEHFYTRDKTYAISLFVKNLAGCYDTVQANIIVKADVYLFVPNAFTPDGDGLNDVFSVSYLGIKEAKLELYNRWGELLYISTNLDEGWDGRYKGTECAGGVYFYVLQYTDNNGASGARHGTATLLR